MRIKCDVEQIDCRRRPRARRRRSTAARSQRGAVVSNANSSHDLQPRRRGAFRPQVRRRRPRRAAEQFQHAGLHGAQAGRARSTRSTGDLLFSSHGAAVPHRAAAEPRHHQPHVFVLLSAHAARRAAAVPDRLQHERQLRGLGRASPTKSTRRASRTWSRRRSTPWTSTCPNIRERIDHVEASTPRDVRALHAARRTGRASARSSKGWPSAGPCPQQVAGLYHAGSVGIIMSGWLGAMNYGVIVANDVDALLMNRQRLLSSLAPHENVRLRPLCVG